MGLHSGRKIGRRRRYVCEESFRKTIIKRIELKLAAEEMFLDNAITIDNLARAIGTNRTYLSQSIKMETGLTFCELVNGLRVGYAKQCMTGEHIKRAMDIIRDDGTLSTEELAIVSGFGSKRNFVRQFRHIEGITPVQYFRKIRMETTKKPAILPPQL